MGKLGPTRLQLHDSLELVVDGIRVMAAADNKLQCILGTDVCSPKGTVVRERGTAMINGNKVL